MRRFCLSFSDDSLRVDLLVSKCLYLSGFVLMQILPVAPYVLCRYVVYC